MYGDTLLLSVAMIAFTRGWQQLPAGSAYHSLEWLAMAGVAGTLLSVAFRMIDSQRYVKEGSWAALDSPTKLWHDFAVFPVVLSLLLFTAAPQLVLMRSGDTWIGAATVLAFIALCVVDNVRSYRGTLRASDQHLRWIPRRFSLAA